MFPDVIYVLTNDLKLSKPQIKKLETILTETWPAFPACAQLLGGAHNVVHHLFAGNKSVEGLGGYCIIHENVDYFLCPEIVAAMVKVKATGSVTFMTSGFPFADPKTIEVWTHTFVKDEDCNREGENHLFMKGKTRDLVNGHLPPKSKAHAKKAATKRVAFKIAHSVCVPMKSKK